MNKLIVIDPGHGGKDPGYVGPSGVQEKDINLSMALKVCQYLNRMGFDVVMTREADDYVCLRERVNQAKSLQADVFLSIHNNGHSSHQAHGTETWHHNDLDDARREFSAGVLLARCLQENLLVACGLVDRGCKYMVEEQEEFYVLRNTTMPAVLVEVAFLSNPREEGLLKTDWFQEKAALGMAFGLRDASRYL